MDVPMRLAAATFRISGRLARSLARGATGASLCLPREKRLLATLPLAALFGRDLGRLCGRGRPRLRNAPRKEVVFPLARDSADEQQGNSVFVLEVTAAPHQGHIDASRV